MSPELQQAVKERVELGHSQEQITAELQAAGYDDETIAAVYSATVADPHNPTPAASLPKATTLFKESWGFALSRLDLLALMAVPIILINVSSVAFEQGWIPLHMLTLVAVGLGFLAVLLIQIMLQLTIAHSALTTRQVGHVSLKDSWRWVTGHIWSWVWIATIMFAVVFGGFLLLIIPGVIISVYIAFTMYTFIDQDARGMSALQRSRALVTGHFWEVLSRFVVFMLFIIGLSILFGIAVALLASVFDSAVQGLILSVFDAFLTALISLIGVFFAAGLYVSLQAKATASVPPTNSYTVIGWFGAVVLIAAVVLGGLGIAEMVNQTGFDVEQLMNGDLDAQMMEAQAELSPEQQAEFDSFMEEFGAELDSY